MRFFRLLFILALVFAASFWWATDVPRLVEVRLERVFTAKDEPTPGERVLRLAALKTAVNTRLPKQHYLPLEAISPVLQQAIIAVEDNRFYHHIGIDINAIFRASLVNLQFGEVVEGGSTISQQLIKNLFFSQDRTWSRKLEEAALALDLELRYSKPEILEMYLNTIYFGENAYGIGKAAAVYFNKPPHKLSLAEAALLAGLPNAPSIYSPYVDWNAAKRRQSVVLAAMLRNGYIDADAAAQARLEPLRLARAGSS
ncbi:MAG: transglycosylase domain-containing protein [Sporomusaceae bacterium]|nr:transglycosylase domain-containing protein [Sporomusaceae bacterium]